jgi:hypothetical protein
VAVDKLAAKQELEGMLIKRRWLVRDLEAYREKGDAVGVARCEPLVKAQERRIREHCAEHGLELPHDVPPEDAA